MDLDSSVDKKRKYAREYMKEYRYKRPVIKGKYIIPGQNDIGKEYILVEERCDNFNELWDYIFKQVVAEWEDVK